MIPLFPNLNIVASYPESTSITIVIVILTSAATIHIYFRDNLQKAVADLKEGFDLVMVYHDRVDKLGHTNGSETQTVRY